MLRVLMLAFMFCAGAAGPAFSSKAQLNVVTTTTLFADLVRQVGGEKVAVKAIASPRQNVHFYSPKPSDVRAVALADLYVNAGLDLEAWSDPLLEAAGKPALRRGQPRNLDLSRGIALLNAPHEHVSRAGGDIHLFGNPHYSMDPRNFLIMARSVRDKLQELDPENAGIYGENARKFEETLREKISEWERVCEHCLHQEIISYHDDIAYFAEFLHLHAEQFIEPKPGIPPTPRHLTGLAEYAKTNPIGAIVLPTYYSAATARKLASMIGTKTVTIIQNAGEINGTDEVISFFEYNVRQISEALK